MYKTLRYEAVPPVDMTGNMILIYPNEDVVYAQPPQVPKMRSERERKKTSKINEEPTMVIYMDDVIIFGMCQARCN